MRIAAFVFALVTAVAALDLSAQVAPPAVDVGATSATVAGKWILTVTTTVGPRPFALEIAPDPKDTKKLTGTLSSLVSRDAVEGEIEEGKFAIRFKSADPTGKTVTVIFSGNALKDGTLVGMADFGVGSPMLWKATRDKK